MVAGLVPIDRTKDVTVLPIYRREQRSIDQDVVNPRVGIREFLVVGIGHFHKRKSLICRVFTYGV
jgi:hypothetical protein